MQIAVNNGRHRTGAGLSHARPDWHRAARKPPRWQEAFTLIELMIAVLLLSMIAMIVLPKVISASQDARESALLSDLQTVRTGVEVYRNEHNARGPHLDERGELDSEHFVERLVGRTFPSGLVAKYGPCGPYLHKWPENPFSDKSARQAIKFGWTAASPRDNTTGWYYNVDTCLVYPNSQHGGLSLSRDNDSSRPGTPAASQDDTCGFRLNGIMEGPDGRVAMINGQRLREGQTIDNAKITEIGDYQVKLELDGREITVGMSKAASPDEFEQPGRQDKTEQPAPGEEPSSPESQTP